MSAARRSSCCPTPRASATPRRPSWRLSSPAEAFGTNFIKLEIHPDPKYLLPGPGRDAARHGAAGEDGLRRAALHPGRPVLCKRLEEAGAATVMPLCGSDRHEQGPRNARDARNHHRAEQRSVVVDAGLGAPSHAAAAMELGADAVLVNTAIAVAGDPRAHGPGLCPRRRGGPRSL